MDSTKITDREARLKAELALTPFYTSERYIRHNGFHHAVEQINKEVVPSIRKERKGDKKNFYIKGIDTAARSSFRMRMNNEFQRVIVSEIVSQTEHALNGRQGYKSGSIDTRPNYYTASLEVSPVDHPEHCASGYGNNPEQATVARRALEAQQQIIEEVYAAVHSLRKVGRLGSQYYKIGLLYLKECPDFIANSEEMRLLRDCLGLENKEKHRRLASSLKNRTKNLLLQKVRTPYARLYVKHIFNREEPRNPKERSNEELLDSHGKNPKKNKKQGKGEPWRSILNDISQEEKERMEAEHNALMAEVKSEGYFGCYRPGKCPAPEFCPCTRDTKILRKACKDHLTAEQVIGHPELVKKKTPKPKGKSTSKKRRDKGRRSCTKAA